MASLEDDPEQFLTVEEIAKQVRVTTETVRRWLREYRETGGRQGLRGYQMGKRSGWRIREADLHAFLERHVPGGEFPAPPESREE